MNRGARLGVKSANLNPLLNAVWAVDASNSIVGEQYLQNIGTGGPGILARYGSSSGAQVIRGGLHLPGVNGNYASVPDSNSLDITGDLEIVMRVAIANWSPASTQILLAKYHNTNKSYRIDIYGNRFNFYFSNDGTTDISATSAPHPFSPGNIAWVKITLDANDGSGNRVVNFYCAYDQPTEPTTWLSLGSIVTAGVASIYSGNNPVEIGSGYGGAVNSCGVFYRAIIRNGIGGSKVLDVDFTNVANFATSFICDTGQTVTITSSTAGIDTNDPVFLPWNNVNYAHFQGVTGNYLTVPNSASLQITGDIELMAEVDLTITGAFCSLINKRSASSAYRLGIGTDGKPDIAVWISGVAYTTTATAAIPAGRTWVKVTRVASTGAIKFYTSTDGSNWIQLGSSRTGTAGNIDSTTDVVVLAGLPGAETITGKLYHAIIKDGIDGTTVLDVDLTSNVNNTSFTCSTGQVVTFNRSATGMKAAMVTRPTYLLGSDDYFRLVDIAAVNYGSQNFTAIVVEKFWGTPTNYYPFFERRTTANNPLSCEGWQIRLAVIPGAQGAIGDGNYSPGGGFNYFPSMPSSLDVGKLQALLMTRSGSSFRMYKNNSSGSATDTGATPNMDLTTSTSVAHVCSIGSNLEFECVAAAIFNRTLTAAEIARIVSYYGTS